MDVSTSTLSFLSAHLRARHQERGTCWRRVSVGRQALLVLAHLRCGHTYAQLAVGFGVGTTTAYRYIAEAVDVLAALAPTLAEAMKTASTKAYVILDGTLLPIDRIGADRPFYSGKHKKHGMNVQVITDPVGRLLWAETLSAGQQAVSRSHAKIRALVEQAMATLKTWRLLRKLRCSTTRITNLVQAVLALNLTCSN
ncbi:transposase family protein [Streptomyces sp. NPDC056669]|uniref:transposase family protein n=1 Tax=Streptomyces sp. NPDC056669 TaxID=3345903 RepID=UPI0036AD70B3